MIRTFLIGAWVATLLCRPALAEDDLSSPQSLNVEERPLSVELKKRITDELRLGFLDPEAARFSDIVASGDLEDFMFCGRVNVKNLYGAYTGDTIFQGFVVHEPFEVVVIDFSRTPEGRERVYKACEVFGMPLEKPYHWLQN